jgi:hypothetical protein
VLHRGPDPERAASPERAQQAGANAVRIARMEPRLAWRLGVHPSLLRANMALLPPLAAMGDSRRIGRELAYARGAQQAWRAEPEEAAP